MQTLELLAKLVSINSVFPSHPPEPGRPGEIELGTFIEQFLEDRGFAVQRQYIGDRFNVLAEKGQGTQSLMLSGHMDTVPAGKGWKMDPWELRVEGDRLYGLGASDMKGGLCAILRAIEEFSPQTYKLKLAFVVDEENIAEGAYTLIHSSWIEDVSAVLVPEVGEGTAGHQQLGPRMLTLGRHGRVDLHVQIQGRSVHAASAEEGVSALLRGAVVALAVKRLPLAEHAQLGRSRATIRRFVSQSVGLSIPELAELRIDRHLVPPETAESARRDVENLIEQLYREGTLEYDPSLPITVTVPERHTPYLMPYVISPTAPFVQMVEQVVHDQLGSVTYNYGFSVADENYYGGTLGLPAVVLGPAGGSNHAPDEWVSLSSLEELIVVYWEVLVRFDRLVNKEI